jgi:hypothetical protein
MQLWKREREQLELLWKYEFKMQEAGYPTSGQAGAREWKKKKSVFD